MKQTLYILVFSLTGCAAGKLMPLQRLSLVETGNKIAVKIEGYCPTNQYKELFALNASYQIVDGQFKADSDNDGVLDVNENADLGLSPYSIDGNADGYSDLFIALTGMTLQAQVRLPAALNAGLDSDQDGIWDSDESLLNTDALNFDTDGDAIPDGLEIRVGADARDNADALISPAGDRLTNLEKIKMNLPLRQTATEEMKANAFQYEMSTDEMGCHHFLVSNISVLKIPTGNRLRFYFVEQMADGKQVLQARSIFVQGEQPIGTVLTYKYEEVQ